jgi:hypothetical protein
MLLDEFIETFWTVTAFCGLTQGVPGVVASRALDGGWKIESHTDSSPAVNRQAGRWNV